MTKMVPDRLECSDLLRNQLTEAFIVETANGDPLKIAAFIDKIRQFSLHRVEEV